MEPCEYARSADSPLVESIRLAKFPGEMLIT
jgi:hypothetical protein